MGILDFLFGEQCKHDFKKVATLDFEKYHYTGVIEPVRIVLYECTQCGERKYITTTLSLGGGKILLNLLEWQSNKLTTQEFRDLYNILDN